MRTGLISLVLLGVASADNDLYQMGGSNWNEFSYTDAENEEVFATSCTKDDYQSPIDLPTS